MYWREEPRIYAFLNFGDKTVFGELVDIHGQEYRLKLGEEYMSTDFINAVKLTCSRSKHMYVFCGNKIGNEENYINGDAKQPPGVEMIGDVKIAPGKTQTTRPMFFVISDMDFPKDSLDELERIRFDENN